MSSIFDSVSSTAFSIATILLCLCGALICGVITAMCASYRSNATKSFLVSLVILPAIVNMVIAMVNGNVGTGVAVMGAFSLVRFRSVPGKARDIVLIFLAMTAGLACAAGYIAIAILFTVIICAVMLLLSRFKFADEKMMDLRITVPESLEFIGVFDDIFRKYTKNHYLVKTKTTNMGSLYKLHYRVQIKDENRIREFIDELRCRNGNLEILLSNCVEGSEAL